MSNTPVPNTQHLPSCSPWPTVAQKALAVSSRVSQGLCSHLLSGDVRLGIVPFLGEDDIEDSVRTTAGLIHVGGSHRAVERGQKA